MALTLAEGIANAVDKFIVEKLAGTDLDRLAREFHRGPGFGHIPSGRFRFICWWGIGWTDSGLPLTQSMAVRDEVIRMTERDFTGHVLAAHAVASSTCA